MKKLSLLLIATLIVFSGLFGQTAHELISGRGLAISSMVSVSNINNGDSHIIGIHKDGVLLAQLDNNTPQGLLSPSAKYFALNGVHEIVLNGGFYDEDDNIVVYGHVGTNYKGIIIKINKINGAYSTITYTLSTENYTSVSDGCFSRSGTNKTYDFIIGNNKFVRLPTSISGTSNLSIKQFKQATSLSVSWDADNSKHVISGCKDGGNPGYLKNFIGTFPGTISIGNLQTFYYYTPSIYKASEHTNKHVLSGNGYYSDGTAYLLQDLRHPTQPNDTSDLLWFMHVNYNTGQVLSSKAYKYDRSKVSIIDVAHNFDNLFVLGHHGGTNITTNYDFEHRYIAQINLTNQSNVIIKHMKDLNLNGLIYYSTPDIVRNLYQNNICFNHYTAMVQSAGAFGNKGFLVENFDMNYSECDSSISVLQQNIQYSTNSINREFYSSLTMSTTYNVPSPDNVFVWNENLYFATNSISNYVTYNLSIDENCVSFYAEDMYLAKRDEIQSIVREKQASYSTPEIVNKKSVEEVGNIEVLDNRSFVCKKFNGTCSYIVYDVYGRIMSEGTTRNDNYNDININIPGLYIIKVIDEDNNIKTNKIVISE